VVRHVTFGNYQMKNIAILTFVISQFLVGSLCYAAQDEAYTKFKQKWSPEVGHLVTVEGVLAGSKLGYCLKLDGFTFEILSTDSKSLPKLNKLSKFFDHKMRASGILRFNPGDSGKRASGRPVTGVIEHFYLDIADASIIEAQ